MLRRGVVSMADASKRIRMIDIGGNVGDGMFEGIYRGKRVHESDWAAVKERAVRVGVERIIVTVGCEEDLKAVDALVHREGVGESPALFMTVGCHPTRANEMDKGHEQYLTRLAEYAEKANSGGAGRRVVAVGELGLDYDRLHFCTKEVQLRNFERQFWLAERLRLPLFLHMRECADDFLTVVRRNRHRFGLGVVHSFTGSFEEAEKIMELGLYIGVNGCSLKTAENVEVVARIPLARMCIETDCPYCDIRRTHASFPHVQTTFPSKKKERHDPTATVKGRNEPAGLIQVLEVVAAIKNVTPAEAAEILFTNTLKIFFPEEFQK